MEIEKKVKCLNCSTVTKSKEKAFVCHIFLPDEDFYYFEIIWVPHYTISSEILKYVIKIKKSATLADLMKAFEKEVGFDNRYYVLTEVHGKDIVKNYNFANRKTTLLDLKIRETDKLYAYELVHSFNSFVSTHFSSKEILDEN